MLNMLPPPESKADGQVSQMAVAAADKLLSDSTGVGKAQATPFFGARRIKDDKGKWEISHDSFLILIFFFIVLHVFIFFGQASNVLWPFLDPTWNPNGFGRRFLTLGPQSKSRFFLDRPQPFPR